MKHLLLVAGLLVTLLAGVALAQDRKAAGEPDPKLKFFVGDWDVVVKFKIPGGDEQEGKAACTAKLVLDGRFIKEEYKSNMMGQTLTVWQTLGYDSIKKKYVETDIHVHGSNSSTMMLQGDFSNGDKTLTLTGETLSGQTGKPVKMRTVTTIVDENRFTIDWFTTDEGAKEERTVVLTHTRKK